MTNITCTVHTNEHSEIYCWPLKRQTLATEVVQVGNCSIITDHAQLRRLADAINGRLADIEAELAQVAA